MLRYVAAGAVFLTGCALIGWWLALRVVGYERVQEWATKPPRRG